LDILRKGVLKVELGSGFENGDRGVEIFDFEGGRRRQLGEWSVRGRVWKGDV
jgi:hypothetical protein